MRTARRIPRAERVRRSSAMAEALGKMSCNLGSAKAQEEFGRWLALAATKAGPHATLMAAVEIMRLSGVSTLRVCGCRDGAQCAMHEREARERAKREELNRICPCGLQDALTRIRAEARRQGRDEDYDRAKRAQESHRCPGVFPAGLNVAMAIKESWREARAAEEERLWGML